MSHRPLLTSPALREPNDPSWGRCPHCKQSAQTRIRGKLFCYRCSWTESKANTAVTSTDDSHTLPIIAKRKLRVTR